MPDLHHQAYMALLRSAIFYNLNAINISLLRSENSRAEALSILTGN
jgi:hypothetical protein